MGQFSLIRSRNCTPFVFFWIPYSIRNVLINFDNCSELARPVGEPDKPVHYVLFSGKIVRALGIVWVSSHSFGVVIVHCLFLSIPYSIRNVLKKFENCSQLARLIGESDRLIH